MQFGVYSRGLQKFKAVSVEGGEAEMDILEGVGWDSSSKGFN